MNHNRERGGDAAQVNDALQESLARMEAGIQERKSNMAAAFEPPPTPAKAAKSSLREPPEGDAQADFFVPSVYDVASKDSRTIMDVAVFRLSKKDKRAHDVILHKLPDGYVRVTSGPDGMASIWDYDIVLMAISHLTDAVNRHRAARGPKPGQTFKPHVSEIIKFCRQSDGGRQYEAIEGALRRLKGTQVEIVRGQKEKQGRGGRPLRVAEGIGLINNYTATSYADTGRLMAVEIELPTWLYKAVVEAENPEVLTMHPDYFLMTPGLGRFLYRLARLAAGKSHARWSFKLIYERSASTGVFKRFTYELRELIKADDLPEYHLSEEAGQDGPVLVMSHRSSLLPASAGS